MQLFKKRNKENMARGEGEARGGGVTEFSVLQPHVGFRCLLCAFSASIS